MGGLKPVNKSTTPTNNKEKVTICFDGPVHESRDKEPEISPKQKMKSRK